MVQWFIWFEVVCLLPMSWLQFFEISRRLTVNVEFKIRHVFEPIQFQWRWCCCEVLLSVRIVRTACCMLIVDTFDVDS
jgi:hypothetical protein